PQQRKQKRDPPGRIEALAGQGQKYLSEDIEKSGHQQQSKHEFLSHSCTKGEDKGIVMSVNRSNAKRHTKAETVLEEQMMVGETNENTWNRPKQKEHESL